MNTTTDPSRASTLADLAYHDLLLALTDEPHHTHPEGTMTTADMIRTALSQDSPAVALAAIASALSDLTDELHDQHTGPRDNDEPAPTDRQIDHAANMARAAYLRNPDLHASWHTLEPHTRERWREVVYATLAALGDQDGDQ